MKKQTFLLIKGASINSQFDSEELEDELPEMLQDDFSVFESELCKFYQQHGFEPPEEKAEEYDLYWRKEIAFCDELRKAFCDAIVKAILKL